MRDCCKHSSRASVNAGSQERSLLLNPDWFEWRATYRLIGRLIQSRSQRRHGQFDHVPEYAGSNTGKALTDAGVGGVEGPKMIDDRNIG